MPPQLPSYVEVNVGSVRQHALVDLGADRACLSADCWQAHWAAQYELIPPGGTPRDDITSASGHSLDVLGSVSLPLQVADGTSADSTTVLFRVVRGLPTNMLLGTAEIYQLFTNIDLADRTVSTKASGTRVPLLAAPTRGWVQLVSPVTVPARSEADVQVQVCVPSGCAMPATASRIWVDSRRRARGIYTAAAVGAVQPDGSATLRVINTSNSPVALRRSFAVSAHFMDHASSTCQLVATVYMHRESRANTPVEQRITPPATAAKRASSADIRAQINWQDSVMSEAEKEQVVALLSKYATIIPANSKAPPPAHGVQHQIDTGDAQPCYVPQFRQSPAEHELIEQEVKQMLANDIIEPSFSRWNAPVVLLRKPDGSMRFCLDFRKLNSVTRPEIHALTRLDDALDGLGQAQIFSTMDLAAGYWQVPLEEASKPKTAFTTRSGRYQFKRLAFGLRNAPMAFQRMMDVILTGLAWHQVIGYIDDLIVFSGNMTAHLQTLQQVFARLAQHGLSIKLAKCRFGCESVKFLGYIVGSGGRLMPDPEKVRAIQQFPVPRTRRQVKVFLGMIAFFCHFIEGFADLTAPLNAVSHWQQRHDRFVWTVVQDAAFEACKLALQSAPTLRTPDFKRPFELHCDASEIGLGAALLQPDDQGHLYAVSFASRSLTPTERRYDTTKRELLAIKWSLLKFRPYLWGRPVTVCSDHKPLTNRTTLAQGRPDQAIILRWIQIIDEFSPDIIYREAARMAHVDALSRGVQTQPFQPAAVAVLTRQQLRRQGADAQPPPGHQEQVDGALQTGQEDRQQTVQEDRHSAESSDRPTAAGQIGAGSAGQDSGVTEQHQEGTSQRPTAHSGSAMLWESFRQQQLQDRDPRWARLIHYLETNSPPVNASRKDIRWLEAVSSRFTLQHGVLYRIEARKRGPHPVRVRVVVPARLREELLMAHHDHPMGGGHGGTLKTYAALAQKYYWPNMMVDVEAWIRSCQQCAHRKRAYHGPLPVGTIKVTQPMECLGMDFCGPLPTTASNKRHILVVIDYLTKWVELFALRTQEAEGVAECLVQEVFTRYGPPAKLLTDQGANFKGKLIDEICKLMRVNKVFTTPYNPACDGLVERLNQTMIDALSSFCGSHPSDWDVYLPFIRFFINSSVHAVTKTAPAEALLGFQPALPIDRQLPVYETADAPQQGAEEVRQRFEHVRQFVRDKLDARDVKQERINQNRKAPNFAPGDRILIYQPSRLEGPTKLAWSWQGPYVVVEQMGPTTYYIRRKKHYLYVAAKNMKRLGDQSPSAAKKRAELKAIDEIEAANQSVRNALKAGMADRDARLELKAQRQHMVED